MAAALNATGRPIAFSCSWPAYEGGLPPKVSHSVCYGFPLPCPLTSYVPGLWEAATTARVANTAICRCLETRSLSHSLWQLIRLLGLHPRQASGQNPWVAQKADETMHSLRRAQTSKPK